MLSPQLKLPLHAKLVIDLFAGGGGASCGIEQAIGRCVDIAINHDPQAIGMHAANHPQTRHLLSDVWEVDPLEATQGRPVGLLHASPDCTHHSQALGGQPRCRSIRSLAWVVHRWAGKVRPEVITLENVEQMLQWSPLVAKRDPATGRIVTLDRVTDTSDTSRYRVADPGEQVPIGRQYLVPDRARLGRNWRHFVEGLRALGYAVQWRVICNADLGAHSTRRRLYLIARRDGLPIIWPEPTHARKAQAGRKRWKPAAECIDWGIASTSIFGRKKPLAEATMRRIAHGLQRYVLGSHAPFIVNNLSGNRPRTVSEPLASALTGGHKMLVTPTLVQMGYGERSGQAPRALDLGAPLGTIVAGGQKFATASAYLVQAGHGEGKDGGKRWSYGVNDITSPLGTVTASGGGQSLATAFMVQANGGFNATPARDLREPLATVAAGGEHHALVQYQLSQDDEAGALRCAAFLMRYHASGGQWADLREPMTTVTTRDRLALVTVWLQGEPWVIVDITLRMLMPRELYNAQDFPPDYVIDRTAAGQPLSKTAQIRMCGNSVSPVPMHAIVAANYRELAQQPMAEPRYQRAWA
ncbi:DNA cytosine methyltransferase [Diaphorobacter limosus]|uniref:DNA (cytosine-5-)-methyltransferase n=1 Tax=Diaphorobacter limosus TaxID=3036128 RepID=A0ABZ0J5V8_9BURK|nr:DNA cytosine methyltransferase [Diaphorobacter sp. Y-1]WOO33263.1 DNA cytosine methyltransferase [Diaphorobacter sp. Y-1]